MSEKTAPVTDNSAKPADTSAGGSSAWSDIAGRMWESLRSDFCSIKPADAGKDNASTENPGSGAGGGVIGEFPADGIMAGDGRESGKKSGIDENGFLHFGDIITGDGGAKLPPTDDRGVMHTGGKLNRETDSTKKPPNEENGGLERHGGKEVDKTGRHEGSVPYFPTHTGDTPQRPGKEQMPKPDRPDIETKSGTDIGGREDVKGQPSLVPPPLRGDSRMSKYGPHPDSSPSEAPSTEDQEAASDLVHNGDVSSMMGLDSVSQEAADAIISGNFSELQAILKGLEDQGSQGAAQLDAMAKQLGNLLGTNVRPEIGDDNKFSLNVETAFSDNRGGCFPTGTSETHLNIPSEGDISAAGSRYWNPAFPRAATADAAVEATRLQALATRSVLGLPSFLNDKND